MMIIDIFPWVKNIFPEFFLNLITKKDKNTNLSRLLESKLKKLVDDHVETLDVNNSRDYIDEYLIEMEKKKDDPDSTMSIKDLVTCIADLLGAGLDTTSISITWAIFYLASFPEVQKRLQKEIDEEIPKGTLISLEHKSRLPYTEAFLAEVLRYSSLAAFGAFHSVSTDTKFSGYTIPKGSVVAPMYASVHFDPKYFPSPNEFKPERFLSSEGKFENPKEGFFPFGNGVSLY
ncbi:Abscisic acid 8'-hydroxylase 2, partial [Armadillidium nasatum]